MNLNELTLTKARAALDGGECSSVELLNACRDAVKEKDGDLHALLETFDDAMESAKLADDRRLNGIAGPLDGIPVVVKDNILVQGKIASAGSKILSNHVAASDSTVARKLKEGGAVIFGRANMDEFAMGSSTERSAFGPTRNPYDLSRVPGGSSGGSAAAVAGDLAIAALGSDTGGSIRQPASFCGVVGLKPTYGRVSRSGLIAMASSLDQIGPLTKSVEDAALVLEAIQGEDVLDQTTANVAPFVPAWREDLKGLRIGLPRQAWGEGMNDGVRAAVTESVKRLEERGAIVTEVDLPYADEALAVYYLLMPCEASANLSRLDGMRYGVRVPNLPLQETYAASRAEGFGAEAKRRVLLGTYALSKGYYDAYYLKAKKVQTLIRHAYAAAFREVDLLLTPTAPTTAFKIGEKVDDPLAMYLEDVFTVGVNVAGLPAISVPTGTSENLPVGTQLIGKHFDEATVLAAAKHLEN